MRILTSRAARTSGADRTDSGLVAAGRDGTGPHHRTAAAARGDRQCVVRVVSPGAGPAECGPRYPGDGLRRGHRPVRCDWDDDDSVTETFGGTLSGHDICTDYARGLYQQFPDRHPGVDGWDGGVHTYWRRDYWEYDDEESESECDDTV